MNPLISSEQFADETALVIPVIANELMTTTTLCPAQRKWFAEHAEWRMRYLYSNQTIMRKHLRGQKCREMAYAFVKHWLVAFQQDDQVYLQRHPNSY